MKANQKNGEIGLEDMSQNIGIDLERWEMQEYQQGEEVGESHRTMTPHMLLSVNVQMFRKQEHYKTTVDLPMDITVVQDVFSYPVCTPLLYNSAASRTAYIPDLEILST